MCEGKTAEIERAREEGIGCGEASECEETWSFVLSVAELTAEEEGVREAEAAVGVIMKEDIELEGAERVREGGERSDTDEEAAAKAEEEAEEGVETEEQEEGMEREREESGGFAIVGFARGDNASSSK